MNLHLQPTRVCGPDSDGVLVFSDSQLLAVLVRLSDLHGDLAGQWFIEATFGDLHPEGERVFIDLESARAWIADVFAGNHIAGGSSGP